MQRKTLRTAATIAIASLSTVGALLSVSPASAAPAAPTTVAATAATTGYYQPKFSDAVYKVTDFGKATATVKQLTFNEWIAAGAPKPVVITPAYVKYSWSDDIYSVIFFGSQRPTWLWNKLTPQTWAQAGYPKPGIASWIVGTGYYKWMSNSSEIFATFNGKHHKLTFKEWVDAQSPTPTQNPGSIARLSWESTVARFSSGLGGSVQKLDFNAWKMLDFPTPQQVKRFEGDKITRACNSQDIYYSGPTWSGKMTFQQWTAAGSPAPTVTGDCSTPPPTMYKNCADVWNKLGRPITRADAGYDAKFDSDGDGIGCENDPR